MLWRQGNDALVLLSRDGVTHGDHIYMVLYALCMVPLAKLLREEVPNLVQPWYADDCCLSGTAAEVARALALLEELGPKRGFHPEPEKSIAIGPPPRLPPGLPAC